MAKKRRQNQRTRGNNRRPHAREPKDRRPTGRHVYGVDHRGRIVNDPGADVEHDEAGFDQRLDRMMRGGGRRRPPGRR